MTALAAVAGAWCTRVHRVPANADAVRVAEAWRHAAHPSPPDSSPPDSSAADMTGHTRAAGASG